MSCCCLWRNLPIKITKLCSAYRLTVSLLAYAVLKEEGSMPMTSQHCLVGATCLEGVHYSTRLHDNLHLFYVYSGLGEVLCSE